LEELLMNARIVAGAIIGMSALIGGFGQVYGSSEPPDYAYKVSGPGVHSMATFQQGSTDAGVTGGTWMGRCRGWLFTLEVPAFPQLDLAKIDSGDDLVGTYLRDAGEALARADGSKCNNNDGTAIATDMLIKSISSFEKATDVDGNISVTVDGALMFAAPQ
jgi:hypothetical protein